MQGTNDLEAPMEPRAESRAESGALDFLLNLLSKLYCSPTAPFFPLTPPPKLA